MFTIPIYGITFGGPALLMAAFSGIGILCGVLSFAAKEKSKAFATVGIALSTAPWIIGGVLILLNANR